MEKADLAALLEAHGGRAQQVASLHILRGEALSSDEQAFLVEHQAALATIDLSCWLTLASPEQRPQVIDALATFAKKEPVRFEQEIARAPHFDLSKEERAALVAELSERVPERLVTTLSEPPAAPPGSSPGQLLGDALSTPKDEGMWSPGDLLSDIDFGDSGDSSFGSGGDGETLGDLLGDVFGDGAASERGERKSPHPDLDAHIASLKQVSTKRAKTAWRAGAKLLATSSGENWAPAVAGLPKEMLDAVLVRAESSPRGDERAVLLEWLLVNGASRPKLVDRTVALLGSGGSSESVRQWLAESWVPKLLPDKASWSRYGETILAALIDSHGFTEMDALFVAVVTGADALGGGAAKGGALWGPAFNAFSNTLVNKISSALAKGQQKAAMAAAASLTSLGIPTRKAKGLASIGRKQAARGELSRLLATVPPRKAKDLPSLEDFIAAVHVLSDAS